MGRKKKPSLKEIPEELLPYVDKNGNIDLTQVGNKGGDLFHKYAYLFSSVQVTNVELPFRQHNFDNFYLEDIYNFIQETKDACHYRGWFDICQELEKIKDKIVMLDLKFANQ